MLMMAQGMKSFAQEFKEQFKKDEKVIKSIGESQDKSIKNTDTEV